jgi:hypothetical protein
MKKNNQKVNAKQKTIQDQKISHKGMDWKQGEKQSSGMDDANLKIDHNKKGLPSNKVSPNNPHNQGTKIKPNPHNRS